MRNVAIWITLGIMGFAGMFIGGFFIAGMNGAMLGMMCGLVMFIPIIQFYSVAKHKGFLPLYLNLKDFEKFIHFPDKFGRLHTFIANTRDQGICHIKNIGFIDDKGDEYAWGNSRTSFADPMTGITVDIKNAHYTDLLNKNRKIDDYDNAIKKYFGTTDYSEWVKNHRKEDMPDIHDIDKELDSIINKDNPDDNLEEKVFGVTYGFKNFARYLKYAFNPMAMENAMERAKIWVARENLANQDSARAMGYAKAVGYILFILMIFIIVINAIGGVGGIGKLIGI